MTLVCYFPKPTQDTGSPVPEWGHSEVAAGDGGFSLKHWWGEEQRHKSIFSRVDENSQSFQAGCRKKFGRLFSAISHPRCPLFLSRIPHSHDCFWGLFIIEIETGGTAVGCVQLGIWQHPVIAGALFSRCGGLLFCTSLAPLCVSRSVCVRVGYRWIGVMVNAAVTQSW